MGKEKQKTQHSRYSRFPFEEDHIPFENKKHNSISFWEVSTLFSKPNWRGFHFLFRFENSTNYIRIILRKHNILFAKDCNIDNSIWRNKSMHNSSSPNKHIIIWEDICPSIVDSLLNPHRRQHPTDLTRNVIITRLIKHQFTRLFLHKLVSS